jgi:hypothetical protein
MSYAGKAIYGRLSGVAGVTALVGSGTNCRIYPGLAPLEAAAPYVVYMQMACTPEVTHDGYSGLADVTVQVTCVDDNADDAADLAEQIRIALHCQSGTWGGVTVQTCFLQSELQDWEGGVELETEIKHRFIQTYILAIEEAES